MVFLKGSLENVEILSMKYLNTVLLSDDQDFTLFHLLAKHNPFLKFKARTFYPLAFGLKVAVVFLLNLLESYKVEPIVK